MSCAICQKCGRPVEVLREVRVFEPSAKLCDLYDIDQGCYVRREPAIEYWCLACITEADVKRSNRGCC